MASVFLARRDGPKSPWVALKRLHPHLVESEDAVQMFLNEARILAKLDHPNLARIEDAGVIDGEPYLATEYLVGAPLNQLHRRAFKTEAPAALVVYLLQQVLAGLHYAHELTGADGRSLGLIHRDVTPHNIFVTRDGAVKLLDFGVARAADITSRTAPGQLKGKFPYLSPEQVRGRSLDRRTDIFSAGVVAWEALAGRPLFPRGSHVEAMVAIANDHVPPLATVRPELPPMLTRAVHRALAPDPDDRFATAASFSEALTDTLTSNDILRAPLILAQLVRQHFPENAANRPNLPAEATWADDLLSEAAPTAAAPAPVGDAWIQTLPEPSAHDTESVSNSEAPTIGTHLETSPPTVRAPALTRVHEPEPPTVADDDATLQEVRVPRHKIPHGTTQELPVYSATLSVAPVEIDQTKPMQAISPPAPVSVATKKTPALRWALLTLVGAALATWWWLK